MPPSLFGPYPARMAPPVRTYRVEHHEHGTVTLLGQVTGVSLHYRSFDLFISRLLLQGASGEVRLIDTKTGAVAARRQVRPFNRSS
jgi:hypothetical protein